MKIKSGNQGLKISFVIKRLHNASGGAERVLADVTAGLVERGHDITILSFDHPGEKSFYSLNPQVKWIRAGIGNPAKPATIEETIKRMSYMRRFAKEEKPDCVVAFMHSSFVPAAFSLICMGVPVIASEHIVPAHYKTRPIEFLFLILSAFLVRSMTVVGDGVRILYPECIRDKISVIHNPVSPDIFDVLRTEDERKIVLNVGRLEPQKDQKTLIEAFARVEKDYPEWILKIVGEGTLRAGLKAQIRSLGLENRVILAGATKGVVREYAGADIFALSSRYESFGMATAEAMASGLPAIGFADCPGTNELIRDGETGFLVAPHTAEAFADALKKLMGDAGLRGRMGQAGRGFLAPYALENVVKDWESLIFRCISVSGNARS